MKAFILIAAMLLLALGGAPAFTPAYAQDFLDSLEAEFLQEQAEEEAQEDAEKEDEIPEAYIQEAENFNQYCEYKDMMRTHYDCECLAAHFLEERIAKGVHVKRAEIMAAIEKQCLDASEAAFQQYSQCKANTLLLPKKIEAETYCTCYGNEYAKIFEEDKLKITSPNIIRVQTKAHSKCSKGSYAVDTYGADAVEVQ